MTDWQVDELNDEVEELRQALEDKTASYERLMLNLMETAYDLEAAKAKNTRLNAQINVRKRFTETRLEQLKQARENELLLKLTLARTAPAAFENIKSQLHEDVFELDKSASRANYWRERALRAERDAQAVRDMF